ncbi:MAG: hybrid sensor histidine kinase/response regulator [Chloroflexi bacterium]|nr:hybrid sensor histidine kinase/response regulator [Chloroflexota bacterium]
MGVRVLYIEDDPASRKLVERTLTHAGYHVVTAERGLEGIDVARSQEPDLILVDINLPDISGREVTTVLRRDERFADTPIVALTAQTLTEQRELALAAGVSGYLTKPLNVEALPDQVRFYLDGGRDHIDTKTLRGAQTRYAQDLVVKLEARIRDLETVNAELQRLDKMKDTFIQLTAHELRTPFTLVQGYNRLMEDNPRFRDLLRADGDLRLLVEGMTHAIDRMNSIIDEILTISRIMTNRIDLSVGPTDLGNVVVKVLKGYLPALQERRLSVHFNKAEWPERMLADWELMELTMSNLISNAIKYTPDDGQITLRAQVQDKQVWFSVKDTGIGIDTQAQTIIFERFNTMHDTELHSTSKTAFRGGGIGLGLALCKGIIEAHGGRIWVESSGYDPDRCPGSEFLVMMPLIANQSTM